MVLGTEGQVGGSFDLTLSHKRLLKGLWLRHAGTWPSLHSLCVFEDDEGNAGGI